VSQPTTGKAGAVAQEELSPRARLIATVGAVLALALASIDVSVVSAAMPRIADDLQGLGLYAWPGVSYAVAAAVIVPVAGKLGDMFGRKLIMMAGLIGFTVASFLCGAAQDMPQLVAFRGLQGLFGGILLANVFTLLADVYTAERRAQMMGFFVGAVGLSQVIGPPLGGVITDNWSWRWVFYVNVPLAVVAVVAVMAGVPFVRSSASWRDIDFLGVVLLIAGLVPLLIGLSLAGDGGWNTTVVLLVAAGVALLVVFFFVETRVAANPIVPFGMFRNNQFAVMAVVAFFSAFAMMGTIFYVPLLYQGVLGVSATHSGSLLIPMMLALMVSSPITGKVLPAMPRYRFLGVLAFAAMSAGMLLLSQVGPESGQVLTVVAMVLIGAGIGIVMPMATTVVQSAVDMKLIGVATSQVQFWRMIAGPVSLAMLGTIMSGQIGGGAAQTKVSPEVLAGAMHDVFLIGALTVAVGFVACFFLKEVSLRQMPKPGAAPKPAADKAATGS
jgi:EmrB/QacA subfamily drug resistance transporter